MQNFQQILTQAAQLKQHQLKKERKGYQSLPQFIKSGLGYNKKYGIVRKQNFHYQFRISNRIKQSGNMSFKQDKFQQALTKYQQALSIFRYIQSKSYENMKDEDLQYFHYEYNHLSENLRFKYQTHLSALYLNICSCLTKLNKKQDAIFSADEALKIKKTAKAHYKKAQCYLKYINRDANDIKLGLLELKEAYSIQKDPAILKEMHNAKQSYEKQQSNSKEWFKFMFDKNKKAEKNQNKESEIKQLSASRTRQNESQDLMKTKINKQMQDLQAASGKNSSQKLKFEEDKQKLLSYASLPQDKWLYFYEKDFVKRHGSKVYSILKIYKHDNLAAEFKVVLAKCLEQQENYEKSRASLMECIKWLRMHPIDKICKYIERYDLQTTWIQQNRNKSQCNFEITEQKQNQSIQQCNQQKQKIITQQICKQEIRKTQDFLQFINNSPQEKHENKIPRIQIDQQAKKGNDGRLAQAWVKIQSLSKKQFMIGVVLLLILARFVFNT